MNIANPFEAEDQANAGIWMHEPSAFTPARHDIKAEIKYYY